MFSTKQSDIFYNDETKEMFVCTVSSISAERCEDNTIVYGALPLIYKIKGYQVCSKCLKNKVGSRQAWFQDFTGQKRICYNCIKNERIFFNIF